MELDMLRNELQYKLTVRKILARTNKAYAFISYIHLEPINFN